MTSQCVRWRLRQVFNRDGVVGVNHQTRSRIGRGRPGRSVGDRRAFHERPDVCAIAGVGSFRIVYAARYEKVAVDDQVKSSRAAIFVGCMSVVCHLPSPSGSGPPRENAKLHRWIGQIHLRDEQARGRLVRISEKELERP